MSLSLSWQWGNLALIGLFWNLHITFNSRIQVQHFLKTNLHIWLYSNITIHSYFRASCWLHLKLQNRRIYHLLTVCLWLSAPMTARRSGSCFIVTWACVGISSARTSTCLIVCFFFASVRTCAAWTLNYIKILLQNPENMTGNRKVLLLLSMYACLSENSTLRMSQYRKVNSKNMS